MNLQECSHWPVSLTNFLELLIGKCPDDGTVIKLALVIKPSSYRYFEKIAVPIYRMLPIRGLL